MKKVLLPRCCRYCGTHLELRKLHSPYMRWGAYCPSCGDLFSPWTIKGKLWDEIR